MQWNPVLLLDDILCTLANGGGVRIGWYADAAWPAIHLLRQHGVRCWAGNMAANPDRRWVKVRPKQARYAVGLLKGGGWAVFEGPPSPPIRPRTNWGAPAPGQGLNGGMEAVFLPGYHKRKGSRRERY
jgi:hypothetical protein